MYVQKRRLHPPKYTPKSPPPQLTKFSQTKSNLAELFSFCLSTKGKPLKTLVTKYCKDAKNTILSQIKKKKKACFLERCVNYAS